ncbi:MAG: hypothetical protein ACJ786_13530, partial [Catenulispora sp.]
PAGLPRPDRAAGRRLDGERGRDVRPALAGRAPAPIRIGENTQGSFSDTLDRVLPNGWEFELPNEEYPVKRDGRTFDITGIPPRIRIPVFPPAEIAAGKDSAFAAAVRLLTGGNPEPASAESAGGPDPSI